jgi:tetratricopeptide (TPR) repeat protein
MRKQLKSVHRRKNGTKNGAVKISLAMIVRDEEQFLEDCLRSVQDLVDEMIIVDTGSIDGTIDIASRFGVHVRRFEWRDDFAAARNEALRHATGDWILYLDADERLLPGQFSRIRKLVKKKNIGAYGVIVRGYQRNRASLTEMEMIYPRLFRNHPDIRFHGRVHEQITDALDSLHLAVIPSDIVINHLGYEQSWDIIVGKTERNIALLRKQLEDNPDDAYARYQLGNSLSLLERTDESREALHRALEVPDISPGVSASIHNLLGSQEYRTGNLEAAVGHGRKSLELAPRQYMARMLLFESFLAGGDPASAAGVADDMEALRRGTLSAEQHRMPTYDVSFSAGKFSMYRARIAENQGRFEEALENYYVAIEANNESRDAIEGFGRVLTKIPDIRGIPATIKTKIDRVYRSHSNEMAIMIAMAKLSRAEGGEWREFLENCLVLDGSCSEAYELLVGWSLLDGHIDEAENWLKQAAARDVHSVALHNHGFQLYFFGKGETGAAMEHLDEMLRYIPPERTDLMNRVRALKERVHGVRHNTSPG